MSGAGQTYTHKHQGYRSLPVEPDNAENVSIEAPMVYTLLYNMQTTRSG
jgi:hypothetical protein